MGQPASRADEKDITNGLHEIMSLIKAQNLIPKKRKKGGKHSKKKNEDFNDIDEFDEMEEENFLCNFLE